MPKGIWRIAAVVAALAAPAWADGPTTAPVQQPVQSTYELRPGEVWEKVGVSAPVAVVASDPLLDTVQADMEQRQDHAAKNLLLPWFKVHAAADSSPLRDRALFMLGEINFRLDERIQSFYNFDELLDDYPASRYFQPALLRQYDIADDFLNGHKRKFLGMRILSCSDEAIEMLYRIQQRSPGSVLAEKCLLRTADYYYGDGDYDLAVDAYAAFIRSYPRSDAAPHAKVRQAFSDLAQFRGVLFDASPLLDARQLISEIIEDYPVMARQQNLASVVDRIDGLLARKMYARAAFYIRTHQPAAAVYNYRLLILTWPDAPEARMAQQQLATMPPEALATAPPTGPVSATGQPSPATQESPQ